MSTLNKASLSLLLIFSLSNLNTMQAFQSTLYRASSSVTRRSLSRTFTNSRLDMSSSSSTETPVVGPKVIPNENAYDKVTMDDIVSLCKRRGFIFPSSEIYNGFAGFYDYGPLGSELKKNVKDVWWKHFVTRREDVVGLDSSIIHNPTTWKSSGELHNVYSIYICFCILFVVD